MTREEIHWGAGR